MEFSFAQAVRKVVIDAGHGGKDSGTVARTRKHQHEKVIALAIAKKVGHYIEKNFSDVEVIYTRTKDVYLTLNQRAKVANKADADLFISIHVDAVGSRSVSGASVYVLGLHRSEDNLKVAMRENAVMLQEEDYKTKYAGFDPKDAESYIIFSLMQNQYLNNSMTMASFVDKHLKTKTKRHTKGVKQAGFYVLREVGMPSVLIETGYITNSSDADYLCSATGQDKTAYAIYNAFRDYKSFVENHTTDLGKENMSQEKVTEATIGDDDTYFTIQLAYSGKNLTENDPYFKGLSPIFKYKKGNGYRYTYGRTKSYTKALSLQQEARAKISDAYLVGFHQGELNMASVVRTILNGK
ncbi:N-acetylmuramoyl-L-alanine amidase family protein [Balneicella halophila]|nr:N-acetylmuramoyl-L-alanine amidase [Balneicella halophila]